MKKATFNKIGIGIFSAIIISLVAWNIISHNKLKKNHRYTIAEIINLEPNARSGYRIDFVFEVNKIKYSKFSGIYKNMVGLINKKFIVKYEVNNPANCELELNKEVQKDFEDFPLNGWDKVPIYILK